MVDVLMKIQRLSVDFAGEIAEIDINPLVVTPSGAVALDALVVAGVRHEREDSRAATERWSPRRRWSPAARTTRDDTSRAARRRRDRPRPQQNILHGEACPRDSDKCNLPGACRSSSSSSGTVPDLVGLQEANQRILDELEGAWPTSATARTRSSATTTRARTGVVLTLHPCWPSNASGSPGRA